jgi:hypothetical protein
LWLAAHRDARVGKQPVDDKIGTKERARTSPPTEEREEARFAIARQAQEGRVRSLQQRLDLAIGHLHRLNLKPQLAGCCLEPASERRFAMP